MSSFKTLGPAIHVTDDDFAVHPVLDLHLDNLTASTIITYVVIGPDSLPVYADPDPEKAVEAAEEINQSSEPGLP
jgi:hypothetical protein